MPAPRRTALDERVGVGDAEAQHVHERVARIDVVERDLAADGRNADAVAVAADAGDDAFDDPARARAVGPSSGAEAQRVQQRDRPRAHREDVADDAADAGRGALVRLDERRMVVRFDLEDRGQPVADVDRAGVLARPLQDARALGRQLLQVDARALVAAVLGPHHREDAELGEGRLARRARGRCGRTRRASGRGARAPAASNALMTRQDRALRAPSCVTTESNRTRPSALPSAGSHARSGCGIRPTTLRRSLQMPAMLCSEPFGLAASVSVARARRSTGRRRAATASSSSMTSRVGVVVAFAVRDRHAAGPAPARAPT